MGDKDEGICPPLISDNQKVVLEKLSGTTPFFLVYYNGDGDMTFDSVTKFNTVSVDTHQGYSTSTGLYTVTVPGIYLFTFNWYSNDGSTDGSKRPCIKIDGGTDGSTVQMSTNMAGSLSVIAKMSSGGTARVTPYNNTWSYDFYASKYHNSFSGVLLSYE